VTTEVTERVSAFRWAPHDVAAVVALALVSALADALYRFGCQDEKTLDYLREAGASWSSRHQPSALNCFSRLNTVNKSSAPSAHPGQTEE
jgi:hypothetical protein